MKARSYAILIGTLLTALCGCTLQHIPKEQTIEPAKIPPFKAIGTTVLTNTQASTEDVQIAIPAFTITVNYRSYTDLALRQLKSELDKKTDASRARPAKEFKLGIVDIKMLPMSGNFRCIINYTVETGDGYVRGLEAIGGSWNYQTAIDTAMANVVVGILNEERILNYLEK